MRTDRRSFLALTTGSLLAAPLRIRAQEQPERRRLFDAVTGNPLPGIRLVFKRVGAQGNWKLRTDRDGYYAFGAIAADLEEPAAVRIRMATSQLRKKYVGFDLTLIVHPDMERNVGIGDFGVIPLKSPGTAAGLVFPAFNNDWIDLLREIFFSIDRQEKNPKGTLPGALRRYAPAELRVRVSSKFSASEFAMLSEEIERALRMFSGDTLISRGILKIAWSSLPNRADDVPAGYLLVDKREDFPRPAVRIRYGDSDDLVQNPHEIIAGLVLLDTWTTAALFRNGTSPAEEQDYARAVVHRCVADALGWRPTIRLPNISAVDENQGPPGTLVRPLDSVYDEALALAVSGGGSGCYPPGSRFLSAKNVIQLQNDPDYPLNLQALT
jgi:hypothetical protein